MTTETQSQQQPQTFYPIAGKFANFCYYYLIKNEIRFSSTALDQETAQNFDYSTEGDKLATIKDTGNSLEFLADMSAMAESSDYNTAKALFKAEILKGKISYFELKRCGVITAMSETQYSLFIQRNATAKKPAKVLSAQEKIERANEQRELKQAKARDMALKQRERQQARFALQNKAVSKTALEKQANKPQVISTSKAK